MTTPIAPTARLRAALDGLAGTVSSVSFDLPGPARADRQALRHELLWTIREYLLPRLGDLDAPVVAVILGSTGSGKSTLLNSLAGARVSNPGAVRPTTRAPVVWAHIDQANRYRSDFLTGYGTEGDAERRMVVVPSSDPIVTNLTVLDAPDFDSVVDENRQIADDLLSVADLCIFVTSAQRYADAVPWTFLQRAKQRGLPLLFVANRLPEEEAERSKLLEDYARLLHERDLVDHPEPGSLFAIIEQETDPGHGGVTGEGVDRLLDELAALADPVLRATLVRQSTLGAARRVIAGAGELFEALQAERAEGAGLVAVVRQAYLAQADEIARLLRNGQLVRREVLARWQDFIGAGEFFKALSGGAGRFQSWLRSVFGGPNPEGLAAEATDELTAAVVRRADLAAQAAAATWERDPTGKQLLEEAGSLWRHAEATPHRVRNAVEDWLAGLSRIISEQGEGKRRTARVASWGVNVVAVSLLMGVFVHTGGLTGAEVGIAAGAAAAQQKLLEYFFGSAAARSLAEQARHDLEHRLVGALHADGDRFASLVDSRIPEEVAVGMVHTATTELAERVETFYGE